ncbi:MAG: hypothetical protein PWP04_581 [Candidatus Atribacteria bacterium]|nr:hypothetical protein [Candidatus Atribacteria bacterium]
MRYSSPGVPQLYLTLGHNSWQLCDFLAWQLPDKRKSGRNIFPYRFARSFPKSVIGNPVFFNALNTIDPGLKTAGVTKEREGL